MSSPKWMQPSISLDHEDKKKFFSAARFVQYLFALAMIIIVMASSAISFQQWLGFLSYSAKQNLIGISMFSNTWQPVFLPILASCYSFFGKVAGGLDVLKWESVQSSLDGFRDEVFSEQVHIRDLNYKHRVTLFRLQGGSIKLLKPCWEKWLIPVARSGIITKRTKSIFRLHDNKNMIEGVVVQAFLARGGGWVWVEDVPAISEGMTHEEHQTYHDKTKISVDKARRMGYDARSYAAVKMEVRGKPWGVLVLDSAHSKLPSESKVNTLFRVLASALEPTLGAI
jgi:hypothetical protein